MELMATPASTMVAGEVPRKRAKPKITAVVAMPPKKAHKVTMAGLVTVKAEEMPPALT